MSTLVLYRKYRPKTFSEVIGQEHVVKTLTNAVESDMVSHAYLFSGPRGSGKTTIARLLAKAVNCQNRKGSEPCNKCPSCLEINQGRAMDLVEIDAASNRGVDEMRDLREGIKFSPSKLKYKVFIIDECHQLTKEAANALLKTLEEPPSHAIFILATTEIHKMIPTIVSRCQRFDFRRLTVEEIVKKMGKIVREENVKIEKEALELIASNSGGSVRDAESLLDQILTYSYSLKGKVIGAEDIKILLGLVDISMINKMTGFLLEGKRSEAITFLNETVEKGKDPQEFAKALISYLRQILILKIDPALEDYAAVGFTKEEKERIKEQARKFKEGDLRLALKLFLRAENEIKYSSIPQLPLELAIIESSEERSRNLK
jgi:DNA polymerase III subunit gamma/tau